MVARTNGCTSEGLVVLRDHTNRVCGVATTVYRREQQVPWRFGRKLDSEDSGEHPEEAFATSGLTGDLLARGEGPELSTELPD